VCVSVHRLDEQTPIIDQEMGERKNKLKKLSRPDSKVQIRHTKGKTQHSTRLINNICVVNL